MLKDVVVVGSGAAGLCAAVVAANSGLDVLLVEKTRYFGGTTAFAGGGSWIPSNPLMGQVGYSDRREAAESYIASVVGSDARAQLVKAFLDNGPAMVEHLLGRSEVRFVPRALMADNSMNAPGSLAGGRSLGPAPYDGRLLGPYFEKVRAPLAEFNAPFGLMLGPLELQHVLNATKSFASFRIAAAMMLRYLADRMRHSRGTALTSGNALVARLLRSALNAGVTLWSEAPALSLVCEDGRVSGVVVRREGRETRIDARRGVVLATGGFSADPELRKKYYAHADRHQSLVAEGNTGDGQRMAMQAGAVRDERPNARNGYWAAVSTLRGRDGSVRKCPHLFMDLPKPGCIAVNASGRRFANEAAADFANAMLDTGSVPAYLICDHRFINKYGMGFVWPWGLRLGRMRRAGYFTIASTLEGLAGKLGIDAGELQNTVARNNAFAVSGRDEDFGKGEAKADRLAGDAAHAPNPCLGAIGTPPFYAVEMVSGDFSSTVGLKTDDKGRVLDGAGAPIAGLYAAGLDANSPWGGHEAELAHGGFIGVALTFGYIVGRHLAE
jgi:succinate dehydrogenase/fumarate reductase flavoprotein subunit